VLLRSVARRRKYKLKRWLPNERSKSSNAKLQLLKNLTIHLKSVREKPHTVLQKIRQSVIVLWLREVVLTLFLQLHLIEGRRYLVNQMQQQPRGPQLWKEQVAGKQST
jgi:hypothetical protein